MKPLAKFNEELEKRQGTTLVVPMASKMSAGL